MGCREITAMIPVWSLLGAILQCLGVAMFCSSAILGFNESLDLFKDNATLQAIIETDVIYPVEISIYTWTGFTMVWAIGFLFSAFMATAQAGSVIWDSEELCCTSPGCVGTSLVLNSCIMIIWIAVMGACVVPFIFGLMLSLYDDGTGTMIIDFTYYGLPINQLLEVQNLEHLSHNLILFFSLSVSGAALVIFGTITSVACMASNWVHLQVGERWREYNEKRKSEEREIHEMNTFKSSERLAQSLYIQ